MKEEINQANDFPVVRGIRKKRMEKMPRTYAHRLPGGLTITGLCLKNTSRIVPCGIIIF